MPEPEILRTPSGVGVLRSALANRNYRRYAIGNIFSHFGTWVQRVAMGWLAWKLTHSGAWLGMIAFADLAPTVVLAPFAGAIADRIDRLAGIRVTQTLALVQALLLAALTFGGLTTIHWLLGLAFARGVIMAFNQPLRFAVVPSLVERRDLTSAIAINSMSFNIARIAGPGLAGVIVALWGEAAAFAFNALSFLIFIAVLYVIDLGPIPAQVPRPVRALPREILDGMRYCVRTPGIAQIFLLLTVVALFGRAFTELLPGFSDAVFGRGVDGLAMLHSAAGAGALLGSFSLARRGGVPGLTRLVAWVVFVLGLALLAFTATNVFWLAVPCVALTGFAMVIIGVGEQTLLQNAVDGTIRGRVMSIYGMISRGGPAVGALVMGWASSWVGLRWPVAVGALLCLATWLWALARIGPMSAALEGDPYPNREGGETGKPEISAG